MEKKMAISMLMVSEMRNTTESLSSSETDWNSSISISNTSSSSEENDSYLMLFPLLKYLTNGRKRHRIEHYLYIVDSCTDLEFKEHLRVKRTTANQLIELQEFIPTHLFGVKPIEAKLSFLIFLWHLANTEPLRTISDRFDVSISSVFRIIRRVTAWILTKLDNVIKWPQEQQVVYICHEFETKRSIRNIIGVIDSTHIRIEKPNIENVRDYCNRKKYFSVNLQAVVDASMKFTNIYCGQPGSFHDARVLRKSALYNVANEHEEEMFSNDTFIIEDINCISIIAVACSSFS
ncbi:protein ANTAGONIST OF LIKE HETEROCHROMATIN PROTEIN 1-like [Odontomachus brunneus]|uniref:protein ANTAGONIST OF LIKE HETEROCHROMATIN PROTEIN 1-like n=1 Tax=Odontomachus brunneus TaxID=486640 RepID=UPI0013F1D248|nr:protein ANTAGONIST OF LIKE HETEROCHROMATIN PROTEIN 1-like [Odontomachus brunneus]